MIERINTSMVSDHFCILPEQRFYRNKKFRTLRLEHSQHRLDSRGSRRRLSRRHAWNFVQARDLRVMQSLKFRYAEDCQGVAPSVVEGLLEHIDFGLADISPEAPSMVLDERHGRPHEVARWLKNNIEGDVLMLEGKRRMRLSFSNQNDFLLARLRFS
jgi:hypothetical protein